MKNLQESLEGLNQHYLELLKNLKFPAAGWNLAIDMIESSFNLTSKAFIISSTTTHSPYKTGSNF